MNFTISHAIVAAALPVLFLLPGYIFLRTLWGSSRGMLTRITLYRYLVLGIPLSLILSVTGLFLFNGVSTVFNFGTLPHGIIWDDATPAGLFFLAAQIFTLIAVVNILAFILATITSEIILRSGLDYKISFLRFESEWFYILSGRAQKTIDEDFYPDGFIIEVELLCEISGSAILYKGILVDYRLKKDGSLDYIHTKHTRKTTMIGPTPNTVSDKAIYGDIMTFQASDIKNINVICKRLLKSPCGPHVNGRLTMH